MTRDEAIRTALREPFPAIAEEIWQELCAKLNEAIRDDVAHLEDPPPR
jgi:hypothetical protein